MQRLYNTIIMDFQCLRGKMRMDDNLRNCRRCLTREMAEQGENYQTLWDYIRNLDGDIKAPDKLYGERLEICKGCDMLFQGMCRKCGCYVELRAAVKNNGCPGKKW